MGDLFSKNSDPQVTSTSVDIPAFLQPLLNQSAGAGQSSLGNLQQMLGGATADDLVAGFTPEQLQSFGMANQFATGQTPFLPTAQNAFLSAAQGGAIPVEAMDTLTGATLGAELLPQASLASLTQAGQSPFQFDPAATDALRGTASGDFLFGGQGFDQAVDAAVRAARPQIQSVFGRAGAGGATGGLAQSAIGQSAVDAFARQFGQERQNQLGAADTLSRLGLAGQQQQLGALGQLANVNQAQTGQQLQAAGLLGNLGLAGQQQQLSAAQALPQFGLLGSDVLSNIGAQQQALQQQQLSAPIQAQQQLLGSSLGALPIGAFLGGTSMTPTQSSPLLGGLGGASALSSFGPWGAAAGGILGFLGS